MKQVKKFLPLFLAALMLLPLFASCGKEENKPQSTPSEETETLEESYDFGGRVVRVMERELSEEINIYYEIQATEQSSDVINNALFSRNKIIEGMFNISLTSKVLSPINGTRRTEVENLIMAGDQQNGYDFLMDYGGNTMYYTIKGYVRDLNQLTGLNFDNDWWYTDIMDDTSIYGKNTFAVGDLCTASYTATCVLFFNKTLATQYEIGDCYQMVFDGDWTFETFASTGLEVTQDLDGDGTNDQFTYAAAAWNYQPYFYGRGYKLLTKDEEGNPTFGSLTEPEYDALKGIIDLVNSEYCWYLGNHPDGSTTEIFKNSQAMFWVQLMVGAGRLRNVKFTFGILPLPKRDRDQKDYISYLHTKTSLVSIPTTNANPDETALLIEKMCQQSNIYLKPAYFDMLFDGIIARDPETTRMLDIIYDNVFMDMVQPFGQVELTVDTTLRNLMDLNMGDSVKTQWNSIMGKNNTIINNQILPAYKDKVY